MKIKVTYGKPSAKQRAKFDATVREMVEGRPAVTMEEWRKSQKVREKIRAAGRGERCR